MVSYHLILFVLCFGNLTALENGSILGDQFIGGRCMVDDDCVGQPGITSECDDNVCVCKSGYTSSYMGDDCLEIQQQIGDQCSESSQCQLGAPGELSECNAGKCACSNGAVHEPNQHVCYEERFVIDDPCNITQQCRENMGQHALCSQGNCTCDLTLSVIKSDQRFCLPKINTIEQDACEESPQCTEGRPGDYSLCSPAKKCECNVNATHAPNEHICYLKASHVGDPCNVDMQCIETLGDLSRCDSGMCSCIPDVSTPSWNTERCLEIINVIGDECTESQQCTEGEPGEFSSCVQEHPPTRRKICDCKENAVHEPGKHVCYPNAEVIGDECEVDIQCHILLGELSTCENQICVCPPDISVPNLENTYCLEKINEIGRNCTENQQCTEGEPGEWSECTEEGTCECKEGAIHEPEENKCFKETEEVGGPCTVDTQCTINLGELSHCLNGTCACIEGVSVKSIDNLRCLPLVNEIGGKCQESQQCTGSLPGDFSECVPERPGGDAVCKCTWEAIEVENVCLRKATHVDDPCNITLQCTPNLGNMSFCSEPEVGSSVGKCLCTSGSVASVDRTQCVLRGTPIGSPCKDDFECVGLPGTAQCASGICGCRPGYIASGKLFDCLPIRNQIGEECEEIQQCQNGEMGRHTECIKVTPYKSICNCTTEAISEPGQNHLCRIKATHVGDECEAQSQCLANLGYSRCLDGHCECLGNATASSNNMRCLSKSFLNETCVDNNQCNWLQHPNSASCVLKNANNPVEGKICRCNLGFISPEGIKNACYPIAQFIGRSCADDPVQCVELEGSRCLNRTCDCDYSTQVVSSSRIKCLDRVYNLNLTCTEGAQCVTEYSDCILDYLEFRKLCKCKTDEFVESLGHPGKCLKIINDVRVPCEEGLQCTSGLGPYSVCRDGFCVCSPGYAVYDGYCYYPSGLGNACIRDGECMAGVNNYTHCNTSSYRCNCAQEAFEFENKCYVNKYIGDTCNSNIECEVSILGMVKCDTATNRCSCQFGYSPQYGNTICSGASKTFYNIILFVTSLTLGILRFYSCQ